MKRAYGRMLAATGGSLAALLLAPAIAYAQQSQSTSYQVNEVYFGPGGSLDAASPGYRADSTAGDAASGPTSSTNYNAIAGGQTERNEYIELSVTNPNRNLGILQTNTAATTTGTFSVKAYLASGYAVFTASDPPRTSGGSTLNALAAPSASSTGTEQFGINLVANTSPSTFGANPVQIPDNTFSYGAAATGYNTANLFKYVKGDIIANSTRSSGTTNYTVSYLYNISSVTDAGDYRFSHIIVATATF